MEEACFRNLTLGRLSFRPAKRRGVWLAAHMAVKFRPKLVRDFQVSGLSGVK
jgi:hypothetical protein